MARTDVVQAIRRARVVAAQCISWYAPALYEARLVITEDCPALAAVDEGWRVYFNPKIVESILDGRPYLDGINELAFVWLHEICHVLRDHSGRFRELMGELVDPRDPLGDEHAVRDYIRRELEVQSAPPSPSATTVAPGGSKVVSTPDTARDTGQDDDEEQLTSALVARVSERIRAVRWNLAADCEINDVGGWGDFHPPRGYTPVTPGALNMPPHKLAEYYYREMTNAGAVQLACRLILSEGSGVDGMAREWELPADSVEVPAIPEFSRQQVRIKVAEQYRKSSRRSRTQCDSMSRWASAVLEPRVDWRKVLRNRIQRCIHPNASQGSDYTFQRPHRRSSSHLPFLRPTLKPKLSPLIACVVDTSGSMTADDLARTLAEVDGVLNLLGAPVLVIPCDHRSYAPVRAERRSDLQRMTQGLPGGGGTDLVVGIEAALAQRPAPDAVVVLTDGNTSYPSHRYSTPVIFGILGEVEYGSNTPPGPVWGPGDYVRIPT